MNPLIPVMPSGLDCEVDVTNSKADLFKNVTVL